MTTATEVPDASPREGFRIPSIFLWRLLSVILVFLAWEIVGRVPISIAFPTFFETMTALWEMTLDGRMLKAYTDTIKPLVIGVGISTGFGVIFGIAMGLNRGFQWIGEPIFVVMQAAPMAALIPLVTFVYGIGIAAKVKPRTVIPSSMIPPIWIAIPLHAMKHLPWIGR